METTCPHCTQGIEIDLETLGALQGTPHFECPSCAGAVPVPRAASSGASPRQAQAPVAGAPKGIETTCPICSQGIEIDLATLKTLRGKSEFDCPSCGGPVPVPGTKVNPSLPVRRVTGPVVTAASPSGGDTAAGALLRTHFGLNRNLVILGALALLTLGGLGIYLVSRKAGTTHNTKRDTVNETIHNKFFTDLIASGATTEKDLLASLADIQPQGIGFIGVSKEKFTRAQAPDLAKRTGSKILALDEPGAASRKPLLEWLANTYPDLRGSTTWIMDGGESKVIDSPDVNRVTTMDRPRRVFLDWRPRPAKQLAQGAIDRPLPSLTTFDFGVLVASDILLWPRLQDKSGNFYGATERGGLHGGGMIFKVTPQDQVMILAHPTRPICRLFVGEGDLCFGVARVLNWMNGDKKEIAAKGAILRFGNDWKETLLTDLPDKAEEVGGGFPRTNLVMSKSGSFFGFTRDGGVSGCGTIFKVTPEGVLTTVVEFTGESGGAPGKWPIDLIVASSGSIIGITREGGRTNIGTVFRISEDGGLTTLVEFPGKDKSVLVELPERGLFADDFGNVYGSSQTSIFQISREGTVSQRGDYDGANPCSFVQGATGVIYAMTGYSADSGKLLKLTPDGALTILLKFPKEIAFPSLPLVDEAGYIYGISQHLEGGRQRLGLIFKVSPTDGKLTTVLQGDASTVGFWPAGFANGKLYGVTRGGKGTVFALPVGKAH